VGNIDIQGFDYPFKGFYILEIIEDIILEQTVSELTA
jgi:hypothetical protein